jgi:DNA polymerase delta subunit 2
MRWRNVAPTAPDTLGCYPYQGKDPFVLDVSPHLYVVGGQDKYESKLVKENGVSVRLIALPAFVKTGTAVLVDVNSPTLEAQSISFKVQQPMEM